MRRSPEVQRLTRAFAVAAFATPESGLAFCDLPGDVLVVGTAPHEWWDGSQVEDLVRAQNVDPIALDVTRVDAWELGDVGWGCADSVAALPRGPQRLRLTVVWRRTDAGWRVVHAHFSVAVANEDVLVALDALAQSIEVDRPDLSSAAAPDGTVTLLFTDIEASTEHNQVVGDREWMLVLRAHHDLIRAQIARNEGFEVKSMGDGFMVAFSSARKAVRCALDIQHAIEKDEALDLRVRIGVHAGEPLRDGDDFYGATVNMASRVAAAAMGGEILVSSLVKALVESSGEFAFEQARTAELKGIPGTHELHPLAV